MRKIKKHLVTVLSLCMVLAGSMTALAAEPEQQLEEPTLAEGSARIVILPDYEDSSRIAMAGGILREEPGGKIIARFKIDTMVYLNGEAEIVDGLTWLRVISSPNGAGWIAQTYLR